ncbi:hypothetical protein ACUOA8_59960, partial [Escherichia sp. SS-MK2]
FVMKANSLEEGFTYCEEMLNLGGLGHSAVIHSTNKDVQKQFGLRMKACRLIVNPSSNEFAFTQANTGLSFSRDNGYAA